MYLGHYKDLSSSEYHDDKTSISRSGIMEFARSPYHYWSKYLNPNAPSPKRKKEWDLGTAFHTMILEPHLFDKQFAPKPPKVLLKDVGREAYEAYKLMVEEIENSNRIIISDEDYLDLILMAQSLHANSQAKELMADCLIEQSYFWVDKESRLRVKARPDLICPRVYIDLKTVSDASERAYQNEMIKYGYHVQAAMVRDAFKEVENHEMQLFFNICVEKSYPYSVVIYMIDEAAVDYGEKFYKNKLKELSSCIATNVYNSYESKIIGLPTWLTK